MNPKQRAGEAAMQFLRDNMVIGLGTGSTADFFLIALAEALKSGRLRNIRGVPTSIRCAQRSQELGIPLTTLVQHPHLDVAVDGADEVSPQLDLIKGMGGALLREKIIAQATSQFVIIADGSKTVSTLGTKFPLPVEVVPFSHEIQEPFFRSLGADPTLLTKPDGQPYVTDNGNYIYHVRFAKIENPRQLEGALNQRAGIVETGLFLGLAHVALIANEEGLITLTR